MCASRLLDGCFAISSCLAVTRFGLIAALRTATAASGAACAPVVVALLASLPTHRWLAELFGLEYSEFSHEFDWSPLLERVAWRLEGDMEREYSVEFPWRLSHLSVLGLSQRGRGSAPRRPVVEHLCCEAYKIAHDVGRAGLGALIHVIASVC